jgi:hypothetical protein
VAPSECLDVVVFAKPEPRCRYKYPLDLHGSANSIAHVLDAVAVYNLVPTAGPHSTGLNLESNSIPDTASHLTTTTP